MKSDQVLKIPQHVGIILDGNGRWAISHNHHRSYGHKVGASNLKKISSYIFEQGVKVLSVFVFSTENFKRSDDEVKYLMDLFIQMFNHDFNIYKQKNIKVIFSGRKENLRADVIEAMAKIANETALCTGGILNICLNYGGQTEIIDACKKMLIDKVDPKLVDADLFNKYLYHDIKPIDLLIRTSGELRISNFMLWQLAYSEMYFTPLYFPDFDNQAFDDAVLAYNKRSRRFGGVNDEN